MLPREPQTVRIFAQRYFKLILYRFKGCAFEADMLQHFHSLTSCTYCGVDVG